MRTARRLGLEISRVAPPTEARRARQVMLRELGIDLVLDVGANDGAWAANLRADGYGGRILSIEPGGAAFALLEARAAGDAHWQCIRSAVGDHDGSATLNVSENSSSSSLLSMRVLHEESAPGSRYVATEIVQVARLDSLTDRIRPDGHRVFLKVDVQGAELAVLRGAGVVLDATRAVECELSLVTLYDDQPLFLDVVGWLRGVGFVLADLDAVHVDERSGELLQVDGLFVRPRASR